MILRSKLRYCEFISKRAVNRKKKNPKTHHIYTQNTDSFYVDRLERWRQIFYVLIDK